MKLELLSSSRLFANASLAVLITGACNTIHNIGDNPDGTGGVGNGGSSSTGGQRGVDYGGGAPSNGGSSSTGDQSSIVGDTGGAPSTGGAPYSGGASSTGGQLSADGTGTGGSPPTSGGAGTGGAPATPCTGTLEALRNLWSDCPDTFCDAQIWATTCSNFPGVTVTSQVLALCGYKPAIQVDWGTRKKTCYYDYLNNDTTTPLRLVAVDISDVVPSSCGTSVSAGQVPVNCPVSQATEPSTCSDGVSSNTGDVGQSGDAIPPANCFNRLMVACGPCCPDPDQDCTGKPDGYPGYWCTRTNGSYCSCHCASGQWYCGC